MIEKVRMVVQFYADVPEDISGDLWADEMTAHVKEDLERFPRVLPGSVDVPEWDTVPD